MCYDELYENLLRELEPLLDFIESLDHNQARVCATYSILSIARLFPLTESLGVMERAKNLLFKNEPDQSDQSLSFIS